MKIDMKYFIGILRRKNIFVISSFFRKQFDFVRKTVSRMLEFQRLQGFRLFTVEYLRDNLYFARINNSLLRSKSETHPYAKFANFPHEQCRR